MNAGFKQLPLPLAGEGRDGVNVMQQLSTIIAITLALACACNEKEDDGQDASTDSDAATDSDVDSDTDGDTDSDTDTESDAGTEDDAGDYSQNVADEVVDAPGHTGEGLGDSSNATNGVHGGGSSTGNTVDVFSLVYVEGVDNYIVLGWSGRLVENGPGTDFAVFENAFLIGAGPACFMDHVVIFLSLDGTTWVPLPHDYTNLDETTYSQLPDKWHGFAGVNPVYYNADTNPVDPFDLSAAGGDHFDLDDLPDDGGDAQAIKTGGFTHIKLVTAPSMTNPDTGANYVHDPISNGADIDGVLARYLSDG